MSNDFKGELTERIKSDDKKNITVGEKLTARINRRILVVLVLLALLCIGVVIHTETIRRDSGSSTVNSLIGISTYTDRFEIQPKSISNIIGDKVVEFDIDLSDSEILEYRYNYKSTYIKYRSVESNIETEIIVEGSGENTYISDKLKEDINKNENKQITIESNDEYSEQTYAVIGDNLGYLGIRQIAKEESTTFSRQMIQTILECMQVEKKSGNKQNRVLLDIDGLAVLNIMELVNPSENLKIDFNGNELHIQENAEIVFSITHSNKTDMVKVNGWNNLYHDNYNESTLGLQTAKGFYCFTVTNKNNAELKLDIVDWLGIQKEDTEIKT